MIEILNKRDIIVKGLKDYLRCSVIRSNQNQEPPKYPYVTYTITTVGTENNGTYGEYDDRKARKSVNTVWSISALSDDNTESVTLANKAREWLDYFGTNYLSLNDIVVERVTSVTNRDNVLTVDYEYKNGFDCFFSSFDVVDMPDVGEITTVDLPEAGTIVKE